MALENEIIVVIPLKEEQVDIAKRHRESAYFDNVFKDVDHTQQDEDTIFWDLGRATYERDGIQYNDYTDFLELVDKPELLKDYFERGVGETLRLVNKAQLANIGTTVTLDISEQRFIFMGNIGTVTEQANLWKIFETADKIDRLFIIKGLSESEFLGSPVDASIIREIDRNSDKDEFMTYFSHYNRGSVILKNQYQSLQTLGLSRANPQSTMSSLWLNHASSYIRLPEAGLSVFANMENSLGVDVNQYFIKKDLTVDLRSAGIQWLAVGNNRRLYTNNNIDSLAKVFDDVMIRYQFKDWIQNFAPTTWLKVENQDPVDIAQKLVRGFVCRYFSVQEMRSAEVGLQSVQNNVDISNATELSKGGTRFAL